MNIKGLVIAGILILTCMTNTYALETGFDVGPGDVLEISVWKDESLSRQLVVPPDGVIAFPLIGDVNVRNMTVTEIRKNVTQRLKDYVQDAVVTVMLMEINSTKAYVIGKVNNPGVFPISMDTSVMQVLSMAGGLNPFAAESRIHVLRRQEEKTLKFPFDYKEVLKGENLNQNITLQRGDVVVVP